MPKPFSVAYLAGDAAAAPLLPASFRVAADRASVTRRAAARAPAPGLVAALRAQNAAYAPSAARERHLDALATPGTAVVVTGQQVGLFLGPLYSVYKAASAVATARALEAETGVRCVPLFWLQVEDHDFAEIDHCVVPRPGAAPLTLRLAGDPARERVSVAHRLLGEDVTALLAQLEELLGAEPHGAATLAQLRAHYRPGAPMGAAFAGLVAELFADQGLVIVDPRQEAVARLAAPLHRAALERAEPIGQTLVARGAALRAAGFDEQVAARPDHTLSFFHPQGAAGPRYRLEHGPAGFAVPGGAPAPLADLLGLLEREPLRFSTSALLRPLWQDTILPTAAYVGGPGELNYFAQLPPLYELLGVPMPLFVPRARFRLVEDNTRALCVKLGLAPADAERPREELLARLTAPAAPAATPGARLLAAVDPILEELAAADPALRDPARKARETFERTGEKLTERLAKALLERDRVTVERVDRLQAFLAPERTPQERVFALPYFAARHGAAALLTSLFAALVPFDPDVKDVSL